MADPTTPAEREALRENLASIVQRVTADPVTAAKVLVADDVEIEGLKRKLAAAEAQIAAARRMMEASGKADEQRARVWNNMCDMAALLVEPMSPGGRMQLIPERALLKYARATDLAHKVIKAEAAIRAAASGGRDGER